MRARALFAACVSILGIAACTAGEGSPTPGTYTVEFPSTAAAVATDFVQVLIFDVKSPADRPGICQELISARIRGEKQTPSVDPAPAANICEMLAGRKPVPIPYGEKALLVIAQRKDTKTDTVQDFMIGCAVMTVGDGDAPLPIPLRIVSLTQAVPDTQCGSVGEYCQDKCR